MLSDFLCPSCIQKLISISSEIVNDHWFVMLDPRPTLPQNALAAKAQHLRGRTQTQSLLHYRLSDAHLRSTVLHRGAACLFCSFALSYSMSKLFHFGDLCHWCDWQVRNRKSGSSLSFLITFVRSDLSVIEVKDDWELLQFWLFVEPSTITLYAFFSIQCVLRRQNVLWPVLWLLWSLFSSTWCRK